MVVIAAMAVMLIGATAFATDSAFAGGDGHKKKSYEKSQAISQVNECGNGFMPYNVGCQNTASQIQGDENGVSTASRSNIRRLRSTTPVISSNQLFLFYFLFSYRLFLST